MDGWMGGWVGGWIINVLYHVPTKTNLLLLQ